MAAPDNGADQGCRGFQDSSGSLEGPSVEALGASGLSPSLLHELPSSSPPKASCSSLGLPAEPGWKITPDERQGKDLPGWWVPLSQEGPGALSPSHSGLQQTLGALPFESHHTWRCHPTLHLSCETHPCPTGRFLHQEPT